MAEFMPKWQNLARYEPEKVTDDYGFAVLDPITSIREVDNYVSFDFIPKVRTHRERTGVHFFVEDHKFERVWTNPDRYAEVLQTFPVVLGPDFSQYYNFPKAVQIYNHYRNNWLVSYWQKCYNINVVPTVLWGWPDTYDWCFSGYPKHSILAVTAVGLRLHKHVREMFIMGYEEMIKRLEPTKILVHGESKRMILPGDVEYIPWFLHKGEQINGAG